MAPLVLCSVDNTYLGYHGYNQCVFGKQKIAMEWGVYDDCVAVLVLFQCGYTTSKIHTTLKLLKLNLCFLQQIIWTI